MILTIDDLGAIKHMDIDLSKDMILFCGPNSTGKTYASYVLFAFLSNLPLLTWDYFDSVAAELQEKGEFTLKREYFEQWMANACEEVEEQLGSIFGISEETRSKLFSKFRLSCLYGDDDFQKTLNTTVQATYNDGTGIYKITKEVGSATVKIESNVDISNLVSSTSLRAVSIFSALFRELVFTNGGSSRMLTVERNSIYTFKTELSLSRNELIDRIQQKDVKTELDLLGMVNSSSRRYPMAVKSSLRIANDLETVQKNTSKYADIAAEIEQNLLRGEVSTTKNGDVEFHSVTMSKSRRLPFHLSSSIVKTMASLVVFLRHLATPGDTLIVDEPEMNFHPDVQIILARIFAKLSNRGLRVVISTHSDYIIREVNNMIMAGVLINRGLSENALEAGYDEESTIKKDCVSVLFFNHKANAKSVFVRPLAIGDDGFEVSTIDDTILRQNQRAEWLYDCLNEAEEG